MNRIKLKDCERVRGIFPLPGNRWLVAGGAARYHTELVWVDAADGWEQRREPFKFLTEAVSVSVPGDWLVIGRTVHPGLADRAHLYIGRVDVPRATWERRAVGDWSPDTSAVRVSALSIAAGSEPLLAVSATVIPQASDLPPTFEEWLVRMPLPGGRPEMEQIDPSTPVRVVACSPDCRRVAIGSRARVIQMFAGPGEPSVRSVRLDGPETCALAFAPDGSRLAAASGRCGYLLDPDTGEVTARIGKHGKRLNAVAFTPDGRRVLTACHDGAVRSWDVATGRLVTEWDFGIGPVTAVAVAPDGLTAAAGGSRGRVVVWDLDD